jgi:hypothetical protein
VFTSSTHAADVSDDLCVSLVCTDRTLDLQAATVHDRDSFYWSVYSIWTQCALAERGIKVQPMLLAADNFHSVVFFINTALANMHMHSSTPDVGSLGVLMEAATRICMRVGDDSGVEAAAEGGLAEGNRYQFARALVRQHFAPLNAGFWEEIFWRQQTQVMHHTPFFSH